MRADGHFSNEIGSQRVDELIPVYRAAAAATLDPLIDQYYPELRNNQNNEYRKLIELSTKMTLVGHACTEIAGYEYDERRRSLGSLFGGCCFLADSFLDDFGVEATREYLRRFERLLTKGWFEINSPREKLFYIILTRLFAERDVLDPTLRQAILRLYEAQKRDVELRLDRTNFDQLSRRRQLQQLKRFARDRSGHAILVLSAFLVPNLPLSFCASVFTAGALIMHIDDHGDCHADLHDKRITYMNQVKAPVRTLRSIFTTSIDRLVRGLSKGSGSELLIAFLTRYYLTRLEKHARQKRYGATAWAVYE